MHAITFLFHAYLYLRCLERGSLEWSCSVAEDNSLNCFIKIYYMILLYKNKCFINSYDVLRALQEQLSTHKKQEQRNGYQMDQLTFRDAHHYSNNLFIYS